MKYKMIYYTKKTGEHVTIAESTFAGKRVKGVSVCHVEDTYDKYLKESRGKVKGEMKKAEILVNTNIQLFDMNKRIISEFMEL